MYLFIGAFVKLCQVKQTSVETILLCSECLVCSHLIFQEFIVPNTETFKVWIINMNQKNNWENTSSGIATTRSTSENVSVC